MKISPKVFLASLCLLPVFCVAEDPEGMECDFENGIKGWTGDGTIISDETGKNKVYSLKKTESKRPEIKYTVTVPKDGHIKIRFRVRGMPGGKGLKLRKATRGGKGAGFINHEIEADGEWKYRFHETRDKKGLGPYERTFALVAQEGVGEIQIDDIRIAEAGGATPRGGTKPSSKAETTPSTTGAPKTLQTTKEEYLPIGKDAAIQIPAGWTVITQGLPAPVLFSAEGKQIAISVIMENPKQVATSSLDEYAKLKATALSGSFPDFVASEPKSGKIADLPAIFFQGPATIEGVRAEVNAMAIQSNEVFYVILGIVPQGSPATARAELMRILRTFRERK